MDKEIQQMVDKAKITIMQAANSVFLSTLLFSLKLESSTAIPTACVDGVTITINPDWFSKLHPQARIGLLAHEAWHVAFNHMLRVGNRDPKLFNIAADYVINIMLKDNGFELPEGGYCSPKYRNMSTEEVYNELVKNPPPPEPKGGMGADDLKTPAKDATPTDIKTLEGHITDILVKAATHSKLAEEAAGTVPGDITRLMNELLNPKLDWRTILQNYMSSFSKDDFSYRRPNKRYMPEFYLPSLFSEAVGEVAIAVDTSGSVTDKEFLIFLSEINDIKESLRPAMTTIIDFDTQINNVARLSPDEGIDTVKFTGGGGTDLHPVFEYYNKIHPTVLIVFSDLWCNKIKKDPGYPVVWICVDNPNAKVNFGELIHFDTRE